MKVDEEKSERPFCNNNGEELCSHYCNVVVLLAKDHSRKWIIEYSAKYNII